MDYIRRSEIGQKEQTDSEVMTPRFLAVQLFAAIAIAVASDFLALSTSRANEMEATRLFV
jgi:hypothetical protein